MSGPKVVRIVTREEIIANCEGMLSQFREAIAQWRGVGRRNDLVTEEELAATQNRLSELETLLRTDQFAALQRQIPREIAYLKSDMARRLGDAATRVANARGRARRLAETAGQLLAQIKTIGSATPPALVTQLAAAAEGSITDAAAIEQLLHQALLQLADRKPDSKTSDVQQALAQRLGDGTPAESLDGWLAAHPSTTEAADCEVDRAIAELALEGAELEADLFAQRQRAIGQEEAPQRRRMLIDTLLLDLANARAALRERRARLDALAAQTALLAPIDDGMARELESKARAILTAGDAEAAARLLPTIDEFILAQRKQLAARARRKAVLAALEKLGYEVREGMETAWASEGKLAVKRSADPGIGVEISGAPEAERMQLRPIRFTDARSASSGNADRDIEVRWCSDFDLMQQQLADQSCALVVEKATPVGEVPVKIVADWNSSERHAAAHADPKTRSI
jgi:hypothetical protein